MAQVYIGLGSNLGDRAQKLKEARENLNKIGKIIQKSAVIETAPWGKIDQPDFLNQIVLIDTNLLPQALLKACLSIEDKIGRERQEKWGERLIDIDILYYDNQIILESNLKIPHLLIPERLFILEPLCEIAPNYLHPVFKQTNLQLLEECKEKCN